MLKTLRNLITGKRDDKPMTSAEYLRKMYPVDQERLTRIKNTQISERNPRK